MQTFKRTMALMLTLVMVFSIIPVGVFAAEPQPAPEMDTGDVTIEGTNGFGNLLSEAITEEQEVIAEAESEYEAGYTVTDLEIVDNVATVTYDSMEEAILIVALYTEDGMQMVTSAKTTVTADETEATVTFGDDMPQYFLASAYLVDTYDLSPLCAAYDTPMYTREMQELLASTVNDYDPELVLNLDEDESTNFAVYAETTKIIEPVEGVNTVASVDDETATYVIENADEQFTTLSVGDVFAYVYNESDILIAKVATIQTEGNTVTITGGDLELEEAFSHMKIADEGVTDDLTVDESTCGEGITYEGIMDSNSSQSASDPNAANGTVQPQDVNISDKKTIVFKIEKTFQEEDDGLNPPNEITITGQMELALDIKFEFYLASNRVYSSLQVGFDAGFSASFSGKITAVFDDLPNINFVPTRGKLKDALFIGFAPQIVCSVTGKVEGTIKINGSIGYIQDGTDFTKRNSAPKVDREVFFEGVIFFGVDLNPKILVVKGKIADIKMTALVGAEIKGVMKLGGETYGEEEYPETKHECEKCLDITGSIIGEGGISFNLLKYLKFEATFLEFRFALGRMYMSYDFGDFGDGTCPHLLYRISVSVTDGEGKACSGAAVTLGDETQTTNSKGTAMFYRSEGKYDVTATYDSMTDSASVEVETWPCKVKLTLEEQEEAPEETIPPEDDTVTVPGILGTVDSETITDEEPYSDGDYTNNRYQVFYNTMTWSEARAFCESLGGHLATITSAEEQAYIESLNTAGRNLWIGGYRDGEFNWYWITGELFSYTNWGEGEPNNDGIIVPETCLTIWPSTWNDLADANTTEQAGFVCEWESETDPSDLPSLYVIYNKSMSWTAAKTYCENLGGHLATITSAEEQAYVEMINASSQKLWLGGYRDDDYNWHWVTGEAWSYSNWASGEPNNSGNEKCLAIWPAQWNDLKDSSSEQSGFICEFEPPEKEAADLSDAPALSPNAVYGGEYGTEPQENCTYKTASFSGLVPGEAYVLYALISIHTDAPLEADNLLCIRQGVAQEDGTLSFRYVQRIPMETSYVVACGASNKNLSDAEITFPEMTADGELQVVDPTVVYDGVTLTEGRDYTIVGSVSFIQGGTYTCYIRGIHNYTGLVECTYTVTSDVESVATGWSGATTWVLTSDGVLTFSGEGNMKNYGWNIERPWEAYADQITSVVIEEGVTAVGSGAFKDMTALKSVVLPDSGLSKIGIAAFYGCTSLEEIYIPDGVYTIWEYTFKNCSGLKSVRLPKTLVKIDQGAFEACTALTELFLPTNVNIIGGWSFKGCTAMKRADMQWADATEIRAGAFKNCTALTEIILPANIQVLGDSCFYGIGATSFTVPATVTEVQDWCFARSALTEITFLGDAPAIGEGAFNKITLTAYYPADNTTWIGEILQNYGGTIAWNAN